MKKKRVTLLALSLIFAAIQTFAQFTAGPKAGLNMSDVYFGSVIDDDIKYRTGLNAGVFGNYRLNARFDVQAELLYSQQGYKNTIPVMEFGGSTVLNGFKTLTHYLNIPVLVRFYPLSRFYLEAGPQVGFRLGHNYSDLPDYSGIVDEFESGKKSTDFSLAGGAGITLGKGFSLSARYCHSLLKEPGFAYRNRVIQFSIAYDLWHF
jgi:hypothetical protein